MTKRKQCWRSWWHQSMIMRMIIVTAMMKAMEIMMIVITTVLKTIYNMTIIVIMSIVMGDDSRWTMMDFDGWMRTMKTTRLHLIDIRNHRVLACSSCMFNCEIFGSCCWTFSLSCEKCSFGEMRVYEGLWGFMRVSWNGGTPKSSILYDRIFHYLRTPPNRHWLLDVAQPVGGKSFGRAATCRDLLHTKYIYGMMECLWCQPMIINLPNITITYKVYDHVFH